MWDTLVLVAPAGSRVRDEALGFGWACGQRPRLCSAPLGAPGCSSLPYLLQAGVQFRGSFLFLFPLSLSHTIGISQP